MKKTLALSLLITLISAVSQASIDCEDVVNMSHDSTVLSAQVSVLARGVATPEHEAQVLDITRQISVELDESSQLPAAVMNQQQEETLNRHVMSLQTLLTHVDSGTMSRTEAVQHLEQGELQISNNLRVQSMRQIREMYSRCFEGQ